MKLKKALEILENGGCVRADFWNEDCYIRYDGYSEKFYFSSTKMNMETPFTFGMQSLQSQWFEVSVE